MQEVQEPWVRSLDQEDPLEKENGNPLQYSWLENPHGQRILVGYRPQGLKSWVQQSMHTHTHDELEGFVTSLFQLETNVVNKRQMPFCISRYDHVVSLL